MSRARPDAYDEQLAEDLDEDVDVAEVAELVVPADVAVFSLPDLFVDLLVIVPPSAPDVVESANANPPAEFDRALAVEIP